MKTIKITVPPEADGQRADIFLTSSEEIPTRSAAQKLLNDGRVIKNNILINKSYKVKSGDILICEIPAPVPQQAIAEEIPLHIIYEDSHLLVINKSRGLVVHPAAGNPSGTLVNALLHHCELSGIGGVLRPGIVHRLDKDTSGLMVVAKTDAAHVGLASQLENRTMGREYYAVCIGAVKGNMRIDLPIGRHPANRKKMAVITSLMKVTKAREAGTYVEILEHFGNFTLIKARLETGRTHQIRVHMAYIGNPVLGDTVYGMTKQPFNINGQILHAKKIAFTHPATGEKMQFDSDLPDYFNEAIQLIYRGSK